MNERPFPDLTPTERIGDPRCGSRPATTAPTCGTPASWHVAWTLVSPALFSLMCDKHMAQAQRELLYTDRHPAAVICDMPGTGWLVAAPSRCVLTTNTEMGNRTEVAR